MSERTHDKRVPESSGKNSAVNSVPGPLDDPDARRIGKWFCSHPHSLKRSFGSFSHFPCSWQQVFCSSSERILMKPFHWKMTATEALH